MTAYMTLKRLVQPEFLGPDIKNPRYGEGVEALQRVTDEPGGFLAHRTDPKSGELKPSYYLDALNDRWLVRIGESDEVIDMLGFADWEARAYYDLLRAEQAAEAKPKSKGKPSKTEEPAAPAALEVIDDDNVLRTE